MADALVENNAADEADDNWLYGETPGDLSNKAAEENEKSQAQEETAEEGQEGDDQEENEGNNDDSHFNDEHFAEVGREEQEATNGDADSQDNGDSDSDDSDDVKVTIGEIKSGPQAYASLNIKRGVGLVASGAAEKPRQGATAGAKVNIEDLEGPGSINGVPAQEFNLDSLEDKPWNKPGADISDYFNYGFNEVTWSAYCERQRRFRVNEAGVGLHPGPTIRPTMPDNRRPPMQMQNEGMPPVMMNNYQARENTIQVMTAERREYGRGGVREEYFAPPPQDFFAPPHAIAPYEQPWGHPEQPAWAPSEIKELTPGPGPGPGPGPVLMPAPYPAPFPPRPHFDRERDRTRERDDRDRRDRDRMHEEERERERDRDRERSRSIKPDRIREKSYRRERSRSRSRRHKSRSRSPRMRSRERERDRSRERERSRDRDREHRERERSIKPKSKESKEKDNKE